MESESFELHFKKLEAFSAALQDNKVSIDELVPRMKEALSSIKICKSVLRKTKSQLQEISAEFLELDSPEGESAE
jgi:exodeoxyribonuclease VII small subunit